VRENRLRDPSRVTVKAVGWFIDHPGIFVWSTRGARFELKYHGLLLPMVGPVSLSEINIPKEATTVWLGQPYGDEVPLRVRAESLTRSKSGLHYLRSQTSISAVKISQSGQEATLGQTSHMTSRRPIRAVLLRVATRKLAIAVTFNGR
jgi:hypothetical protein